MLAFFAPGPMEMLIILFLAAMSVGSAVLVFVILKMGRKSGSAGVPIGAGSACCADCGSWVLAEAKYCHQCGSRLPWQQGP